MVDQNSIHYTTKIKTVKNNPELAHKEGTEGTLLIL